MRVARVTFLRCLLSLALAVTAQAQKIDGAVVVGASFISNPQFTFSNSCVPFVGCQGAVGTFVTTVPAGHPFFLEGALAVRVVNAKVATLALELPVAAIPLQHVTAAGQFLAAPASAGLFSNMTSTYVTPGLRAKLLPGASISPFVSVGGGWARYSLGPASNNKGALEFGGGVDFKTGIPLLGFRAEVRDFVTSEPRFDLGFSSVTGFPVAGSQDLQGGFHRNNVLVGGGAVFRF